jgi:hypothetical protein
MKGSKMKINESKLQRIIREELGDRSVRDLREFNGDYLLDFLEIEGAWEIVEAIRNPDEPDSLIYVWNEVFKGGKKTYREWSYDFPLGGFGVEGVSFEEMGIRNAKIKLVIDAAHANVMSAETQLEDYGAPSVNWFLDYVHTDIEIVVPDFDLKRSARSSSKMIPLIKLYSGYFKSEQDNDGNYKGYFGEAPRLSLVMPPKARSSIDWFIRRRAAITLETVIRRQVRRILSSNRR